MYRNFKHVQNLASLPFIPVDSRSRSQSPLVVISDTSRRSRFPIMQPYQRRARSRSPPPLSDDEIDPSLDGLDGLHVGQRATAARLKNPGKYTDKSMRRVHSVRSKRRERTAKESAIIGDNDVVRGACVNDFGTIKPCRDLVTRVNYRPTYVKREQLPLQMLFAMLLDEQPDVVSTYDGFLLRSYLAGVIARALSGEDAMEPTSSQNLVGFANRALALLSRVDEMTGDLDPIKVLAERYMKPITNEKEACAIIKASIKSVQDTSVLNILQNLKTLVYDAIPQVRLWSYDSTSPESIRTVLLRRGQLREHPLEQLKIALEQSIEMFRAGNRRAVAANIYQSSQHDNEHRSKQNRGTGESGSRSERSNVSKIPKQRIGRTKRTNTKAAKRSRSKSPSTESLVLTPDITEIPLTPGRFLDKPSTSAFVPSPKATYRIHGQKKSKSVTDSTITSATSSSASVPGWLADVDNY